nr:amino acid permease [Streptomyces sp. NBC_00886]
MAVETDTQSTHPAGSSGDSSGCKQQLPNRQIQMIGIGGAIGTGLFLGAGGRLASAGPALAIVYAFCGIFAFFILRALGELVLHRPNSGSFVSYAREFFGEKAAYVSGWVYSISWALTAIVDITAVATYFHYWPALRSVPQWLLALTALLVVTCANLVSVRFFGEMEFWFALVKVAAIVVFLVTGAVFLAAGFPVDGHDAGLSTVADNGGILPNGLLPAVIIVLCQLRLYRWSQQGRVSRPAFRLFGAPWTSYLTLLFLFGVLVLMLFDYPVGTFTVGTLLVIVPALIVGWFGVRGRVLALAADRRTAGSESGPTPQ